MFGIAEVATLINTAVTRIWPDATEQEKGKLALLQQELAGGLSIAIAQSKVNEISAANPSIFVSGARPFIMWICGFALLYASLLEPILRFVATVYFGYAGEFPVINTDMTTNALMGMLGLGTMRSFEKTKGVARHSL
tara:strand:+ start:1057 stop:1467 length:411 start_codon:yes stop_codon:yes gene_type:complete